MLLQRLSKRFFLCFVFGFFILAAFRVDAAVLTWCSPTNPVWPVGAPFYSAVIQEDGTVYCLYSTTDGDIVSKRLGGPNWRIHTSSSWSKEGCAGPTGRSDIWQCSQGCKTSPQSCAVIHR